MTKLPPIPVVPNCPRCKCEAFEVRTVKLRSPSDEPGDDPEVHAMDSPIKVLSCAKCGAVVGVIYCPPDWR